MVEAIRVRMGKLVRATGTIAELLTARMPRKFHWREMRIWSGAINLLRVFSIPSSDLLDPSVTMSEFLFQ